MAGLYVDTLFNTLRTAKLDPLYLRISIAKKHSDELLLGDLTESIIRGPTGNLAGLVPDFMPGLSGWSQSQMLRSRRAAAKSPAGECVPT